MPEHRRFPAVTVALGSLLTAAVVAIPVVWVTGAGERSEQPATATATKGGVSTAPVPKPAEPEVVEFVENATGPQASFYSLADGHRMGTATERFARPALSLAKLFIAEYVIEHGTEKEKREAVHMISDSSDVVADELYEKYPESIDKVAEEYGLYSTRGADRWGYSDTSTYDVVTFVATLLAEDPTHPILEAMHRADPVAADGYGQDFGTSLLPGASGTKWGWSDDLSLHSSVTFGDGWVAAAAVTGSQDDLTKFVKAQMSDAASDAEKAADGKRS